MTKKGKIIRNGIEYSGGGGSASDIMYLTQAEYDALPESKLTNGVEYRITDAGTMAGAENVGYDNSKSGLEAVNVQDAIDKLDESLEEVQNSLNNSYDDLTTYTKFSGTFNAAAKTQSYFNIELLTLPKGTKNVYFTYSVAGTTVKSMNKLVQGFSTNCLDFGTERAHISWLKKGDTSVIHLGYFYNSTDGTLIDYDIYYK